MGYRVTVPSTMNISVWEEHLRNYYDTQLIDFLKYGFPLDMVHNAIIDSKFIDNHPTASQYPQELESTSIRKSNTMLYWVPLTNRL